jgi:hypothetical protein
MTDNEKTKKEKTSSLALRIKKACDEDKKSHTEDLSS